MTTEDVEAPRVQKIRLVFEVELSDGSVDKVFLLEKSADSDKVHIETVVLKDKKESLEFLKGSIKDSRKLLEAFEGYLEEKYLEEAFGSDEE